jgi:hypothetical protein
MLSANDVHYLVGFLTIMSNPDDVEISLGDLVYDEAAEETRDVDITVTYKDEKGLLSAFKGIEVKRIGRPLDVAQVEQLAAKFRDMPALNHKSIVSASGFSKPAVKKAAAHGVELFTFAEWANPMVGFDHIKFVPWATAQQNIYTFALAPQVIFNPTDPIPDEIKRRLNEDSQLCDSTGSPHVAYKTIRDLTDAMEIVALNQEDIHSFIQSLASGQPEYISVNVELPEEIFLKTDDQNILLKTALMIGPAMRVDAPLSLNFRVLVRQGEKIPIAGCAITELSNGTLVAIGLGQIDRSVKFVPVPLSIRNRNRIRELKLK